MRQIAADIWACSIVEGGPPQKGICSVIIVSLPVYKGALHYLLLCFNIEIPYRRQCAAVRRKSHRGITGLESYQSIIL